MTVNELGTKFRVLSLDGGGVRGIVSAKILQYLEEKSKKPISRLFDLIVGTSTGGIIALGLACPGESGMPKYTAKDIVQFYLNYSKTIFSRSILRTFCTGFGLWSSKYSRSSYDKVLNVLFSNIKLGQAICPVIIPTYSLIKAAPNIFSSRECKEKHLVYLMSDIAGATSAAPTYLPPKSFKDTLGNEYIEADGGIYANNPEELAIAETFKLNEQLLRSNIEIVSIGTGTPRLKTQGTRLRSSGIIGWVMNAGLIDIMLNASSDWSSEATSMLNPNTQRLQVVLNDGLNQLDNAEPSNLQALLSLSESYINNNRKLLDALAANLKSSDD